MTDREYLGGGFNRVGGTDVNWHPTSSDNVNAAALLSSTRGGPGDPTAGLRPDTRRNSAAGYAVWTHLGSRWTWGALAQQVGNGFRPDLGFVPAAGFREIKADLGRRWFDLSAFNEIRPTLGVLAVRALAGDETIVRSIYPGVYAGGPRGLYATVELHLAERARADAGLPLENLRYLHLDVSSSPASWWPKASLTGDIGQQLDLETGRVRPGGSLALETAFRPTDRLEFDVRLTRAWLRANTQDRTPDSLLLDQQGVQAIAWLHLSVANELRLQAFRERDASATDATTHRRATSLLFLHRTNWRSAWYVGVSRNDDPQFPEQRGWELLAKWISSYGNP